MTDRQALRHTNDARDSVRTGAGSDPLSEILRLAEATSVIYGGLKAGGRWSVRFPPPQMLKFAAMAKGACWAVIGRGKPIRVKQGDVLLLSGRDAFLVGSALDSPPLDAMALFANKTDVFTRIGDGNDCIAIAGGIALNEARAALLQDVLPNVIHVRAATPAAATLGWIVQQITEEGAAARPGASIVMAQLAQLLFIQMLRVHLMSDEALPPGWLRAVRDERLVSALRCMHAEPARAWSLQDLSKTAGMSRTSFVTHFKATVGLAPLAYLTQWRMRLAEKALREGNHSMLQVAELVGYASESAFSHAFKRETGRAPHQFRRGFNG